MDELKRYVREIQNFPKPGVLFYDITTLLQDPAGLRRAVDQFVWLFASRQVDKVVGIESRGFLFGPVVAYNLNAGFVPVRKPGKLPWETVEQSYELEYGSDSIEMHEDAIHEGERVLIVDDLIATGGTARAATQLVESVGGTVSGLGFLVELSFLEGRKKLDGFQLESLMIY